MSWSRNWWLSVGQATRTRYGLSRPTASRSTSTKRPTLPERYRRGVYDLMCARPHMPEGARYTADEFRTYREGYAWALVMAMRVLDLADEQHAIMERHRRRIGQRQRREAEPQRKRA